MLDLKPEWQTIQDLSVSKADFERQQSHCEQWCLARLSVQYSTWESTTILEPWTNSFRLVLVFQKGKQMDYLFFKVSYTTMLLICNV